MAHDPSKTLKRTDEARTASSMIVVDAEKAKEQASCISQSLQDVVRQTGWLLHRRAQLIRQGHGGRESLPLLYPLAQACKDYLQRTVSLRDHILRAQVLLERALERTQGAQPVEDFASSIAPDTSLAQLDPDLYRVISSMPLDWSGEQNNNTTLSMMPDVNNLTSMPENVPQTASIQQPGADVSSAIAVDSDDDESLSAPSRRGGETVSNDQPTKRRKVDAAPTQTSAPAAPEDTTDLVSMLLSNELGSLNDTKKKEPTPTDAKDASATNVTDSSGLDQLIADNMSDLSWLDFSSLGNQNSSDNTQLSTLFGESSADTPGANVGGLTSLDFSDQEKMNG